MSARQNFAIYRHYLFFGLLVSIFLIVLLLLKNKAVQTPQSGTILLWNVFFHAGMLVFIYAFSFGIAGYFYRKKIFEGKVSYFRALSGNAILTLIGSFTAGLFQIVYVRSLNPAYLENIKQRDLQTMKNLGLDEKTIQQNLTANYENWDFFSDTFLYFLLIGLFVAILMAAFSYKNST